MSTYYFDTSALVVSVHTPSPAALRAPTLPRCALSINQVCQSAGEERF